MVSPIRWTWVWASVGSWWWKGKPGMLQSVGSQRVRHDWTPELNWTELNWTECKTIKQTVCYRFFVNSFYQVKNIYFYPLFTMRLLFFVLKIGISIEFYIIICWSSQDDWKFFSVFECSELIVLQEWTIFTFHDYSLFMMPSVCPFHAPLAPVLVHIPIIFHLHYCNSFLIGFSVKDIWLLQ